MSSESGEIHGADFVASFNPLTVLGDLLDTVFVYEEVSTWTVKNYTFQNDYHKHPFFQDKDYLREIEVYRAKTDRRVIAGDRFANMMLEINSFIISVDRLHRIFKSESRENISLGEFETIKAFNELAFTFEVQQSAGNEGKYQSVYFGTHVDMGAVHEVMYHSKRNRRKRRSGK